MNYEEDIKIDETALDVEWLNQSALALRYARNWAHCKNILMRTEESIKVIRAELINKANSDPDRYLGKDVKPTVSAIEAFYRTHKRHIQAKDEWLTASYECNMAEVAKNEFSRSRKESLENLVRLHGQNYFAGPSMPRDLTWEKEQKELRSNKAIAGNLNRRTRTK